MRNCTSFLALSVRPLTVISAVLIAALTPAALPAQDGPPGYTLEMVDIFPPEELSLARDMNARGQIVGDSFTRFVGWIYEDGQIEMVEYPGADATTVFSINDHGTVFGYYRQNPGESERYGFSRDEDRNFTDINYPGSNFTRVNGGNNRGDAVGFIETPDGGMGFTRSKHGVFTDHNPPDAIASQAIGINERGLVTGFFLSSVDFALHGYTLDRDGVYTVVEPPSAVGSDVTRSNNKGDIVGHFSPEFPFMDDWCAYLKTRRGKILDVAFPDPDSFATQVVAITDEGDMCATVIYFDPDTGAPSTYNFLWRKIDGSGDDDDNDNNNNDD